ncbi:hypothetical protein VBQ50_06640 [Klebsiella pneumoniae]|uniref:hypothetical protein n=1 Tax=Klebsiella TaxID=570 RepID=UPI001033EF2A|nr:hypothetical protein [Klebsiella pneumoniae]ELA2285387.1 hypothetical protein [Klebsiella pneumoniae]ELA2484989.1 hypothetical protein [Klebsiella pneumoniae]ELW9389090.1 hypothetical protein [Klebsiella pneumoniae]MCP5698586.1 hypothetical protein [Klebsiella pneumoniae]MCQ8514205.1 hypothetical protein [Klebsiella pneumoniae]
MKRLILAGALALISANASANVTYHMCSYRNNLTDSHPNTGAMVSFGMWQGEGYYDVEGVIYNFTSNTPENATLTAKDGSQLYGRNWAGNLMSFAILSPNGNRTIYACEDLQENDAQLSEAINDMTYPDDNKN